MNIPSKNALVLEFPYHLQIVNYKFDELPSKENPNKKTIAFSLINLGLNFSIESERADFLTITPANTLLYMDEKGLLVNCFIGRPEGKLKKKFKRECVFQYKQTFLSKCNGIMRKIK